MGEQERSLYMILTIQYGKLFKSIESIEENRRERWREWYREKNG